MIQSFEGLRLEAYQDSVGVWTIGYGHTGPEVKKGLKWNTTEAEAAFDADVARFCQGVAAITKSVPLTDNQFAALVSFAYNLGLGRLQGSTLLKKVLAKDWAAAKTEFLKWDKAGGKVLAGLARRRRAEADLFGA
jgi:lysozyme